LTQINFLVRSGGYQGNGGNGSSSHVVTDEGFQMFSRKGLLSSAGRHVVMASIAVLVFTLAEPPMAAANSSTPLSKGVSATAASGDATDFSARRR
jgi:hypothetical protein